MKTGRIAAFPEKVTPVRTSTQKKTRLFPRFFLHEAVLNNLEDTKKMDLTELSNLLNSTHFLGESISVILKHPRYEKNILAKAYPEPSIAGKLTCRWVDGHLSSGSPEEYKLVYLMVDDHKAIVLVPGTLEKMGYDFFSVQLPETSYIVNKRRSKRYGTPKVEVDLIQDGFEARGDLVDFNPYGFRVRVTQENGTTLNRFNAECPVTLYARQDKRTLFSNSCLCIRQRDISVGREIVLAPNEETQEGPYEKQVRNPRQRLVPSPTLIFKHPFLKRKTQLNVSNISTSGFCVYEEPDDRVLMKNLVIPEVYIDFAGGIKLKCAAKVVYRSEEKKGGIHYGLTILDMDIGDYSRLTHILTKALDPYANIYGEVDMEALWEFLFNSGFIYSQKYRAIHVHREKFKETYKKLYQDNPDIAKQFIYQKNGRIFGHISMVRVYEKSWMIHHHAARAMIGRRAGFRVLKQIMLYMNDLHRLPSAHMDHVMCYFRPESKFPDRVFGRFARELNDPRGCSLDLFSYFLYPALSVGSQLPKSWTLQECSKQDMWDLGRCYNKRSGGLFLNVFHPRNTNLNDEPLEHLYSRAGLVRKWKAYSLTLKGKLKAILILNQSNLGLNLSELLNSISILVTDTKSLPWDILSGAINQLTHVYQKEKVPLLIYPHDYLETWNVSYEMKKYFLWILNVQYGNDYLAYMRKRFRIGYE